ncbi:tetrapyrrole methylase family protein / MazG family protein [Aneurinibacillus thermoaerophilus]|uniref:Tetrapyrrole methylase family protein / MazG family protein n=1 Tax=Aneurinibacillus thermoaerophilus TaxID=143495 RepID=A0A1G8DQH0_ANETH|nr:nucleoside triphosphate pyrophosphohydrolase [Aneurinibacillus thermoaerophilus]MED0675137.1 nucleoside triphosphate pyrophosphohydrolase [Aneurinibacillus thermoaerophilus]SDH59912.1 tetrapyrrole methylase family protein / MazG family protein [Aneurinibacillus thermoaerophilus]
MNKITVIGLGAGNLEGLPLGIYRMLKQAQHLYIRTEKHPVVAELAVEGILYESFDEVYEAHDQFSDVYEEISKRLLELATKKGNITYAVPGHPLVAERTVQLLLAKGKERGIEIEIKGGQSFLEPVFSALKVDPVEGFSLLDATDLRDYHIQPKMHHLICQVYDAFVASDVKLTLMEVYPDDFPVTVVTAAGVAGQEKITTVPLYELDRLNEYSNLTIVYVPPTEEDQTLNRQFWRLREIVAILRSPEGCPWDREQTHQSIRKNLIEETYEVLETIDDNDPEALCEEMGDLLLQIMLHSQMAEEDGYFTVRDVIEDLNKKLIRRHPHVFGNSEAENAEEALQNWKDIKEKEKREKGKEVASLLDGVPRDLPALYKAYKYQKKAAEVGFDWDKLSDVLDKVKEELEELNEAQTLEHRREELGDLLFVIVNVARFMKIDPEEALALTNKKFYSRFSYIEEKLREAGKTFADTTLEEMESWWQEAKTKKKEGI